MHRDNILKLCFYGFGIEIKGEASQTIQDIKRDYSYFEDNNRKRHVQVEIFSSSPAYGNLPGLTASVYTPRNICYKQGNITYIDYFGKGLTIADSKTNVYKIYSQDAHLRHEIAYLTIMSLVGQYLDSKSIHRVHGFGIEINGKAALVLLPRGGGKTTLLLELLKKDGIKLISEDSPLINKAGKILPFPIRIGVSGKERPGDIPDNYLRLAERMEFGPKYLIDIGAFKEKVSKQISSPWVILVGIRSLGPEAYIQPLSKLKTLREFIKNSVVGLGLYQGVEFILERSILELFSKTGLALSRLRNSLKITMASKSYSFIMGNDTKKNADTLIKLLK